jgi:hypothetical protein
MKKLFTARSYVGRKNYRSERMGKIRSDVAVWMQEYEHAKTATHRNLCMDQIRMNLKRYEYYGHR